MNGQKGIVVIIVAMVITAGIGFFANVTETTATKLTYSKITDLEGIIGENAGDISSYSEYSPTSNITGWNGNSVIPLTDSGAVSPYVISPRGVVYTPENYTVNMRSFTYTTGDISYASNNISTSVWATSNNGVTYASYPIIGTASEESRDDWIEYSDGSTIHGGMSTQKSHSAIGSGYYTQIDNLKYYIADETPTSAIKIFATVSDVLAKAGVTLDNNYRVSSTGTVLYNCNLYADKYYTNQEYDTGGNLRKVTTHTDVYLQGYKSTAAVINYMNGVYTGLDENGTQLWSSSNVYIYTTKANITLTVGIPSIRNPTYADPYQLTTITDSEYVLDPVTHNYTFDWNGYPLTANGIIGSQTYTIDNTISPYIASMSLIPDTYGDIQATLSDGSTVSMDEDFLNLFGNGVWGYKPGGFSYVWDGSTKQVVVNYRVPITGNVSSGYVYYMFTNDLISKYVPNPIEGDIVSFNGISGINSAYMLYPNTTTPTNDGLKLRTQYYTTLGQGATSLASFDIFDSGSGLTRNVQLSDVYFRYIDGIWQPFNISTDSPYTYFDDEQVIDQTTSSARFRTVVNLGNIIVLHSTEESSAPAFNLELVYSRNTVQFSTTDPNVVFGDFVGLTLSDNSPLYGGQTTDWLNLAYPVDGISQVKLAYGFDGERSNLRWANLRDIVDGLDDSLLVSAVRITLNGQSNTGIFQNIVQSVTITNPTSTSSLYTVSLTGNQINCDHLEYNMAGYWEAYLGTGVVWSGQLSELTLVTDNTANIGIVVVTEGYVWTANPTSDSKIAYWSNGADNPTIVNGSVSLLLVPIDNVVTDIQIYTGDVLQIHAVPQGSGYNFTYTIGNSAPVNVGVYVGLYVTYSIANDTLTIAGLTSLTNAVAYAISPIVFTSDLENTESLRFLYFLAIDSDWGAYITQTIVENDPLGMLWGGFNVNLNNYLSMDIPGLRVTINGVVAYGDSLTINGITLPVADGKITYEETQYTLKGSSIEYRTDGNTYLNINEGMKTELNLGTTQDYSFAGEGAWYFSTAAYKIIPVTTTGYEWQPGWELNWNECLVLFCVATIMLTIVCMRFSAVGELDWMDWIVIIGAIVICFCLIGGSN